MDLQSRRILDGIYSDLFVVGCMVLVELNYTVNVAVESQQKSHGGGAHPEPPRRAPDTSFTGNHVQVTKDYIGHQLMDSKVSFSLLMESHTKLCIPAMK
jgi:hypothetical protein